jgi:S1-C subfamily serine protease
MPSSKAGQTPPASNRFPVFAAGLAAVAAVAIIASVATTLALSSARGGDPSPAPSDTAGGTSSTLTLEAGVATVLPATVSIGTPTSNGSGVVVSADGWILTNRHVVDCETAVNVTFADGTRQEATVEAIDSLTDLALVRAPSSGLTPAVLGDSGALEVGQPVAAIGNSEGYLANTVTSGVVSALGRQVYFDDEGEYRNLIQTDAAIYGGNSGGPLITLAAEVVGINTLGAVTDEMISAESLSFAIPSALAAPIVTQAVAGRALLRPWLGVRHVAIDGGIAEREGLTVDQGALISRRVADDGTVRPAVSSGGPAHDAGIREGDVIIDIDGEPVDARHPLDNVLASFAAGTTVGVTLVRGGEDRTVDVTLGEREGRPVGC